MVKVAWDIEAGNALARAGKLGEAVKQILAELKPEAAYFYAVDGKRGGVFFVNMDDASQIPAIAEPWFLKCNATIEFTPVMVPEDLMKAEPVIAAAVKKYG